MKIAYVTNSRFPSERAHMVQIVHMCNAFAELGHEVKLFVTDRETDINDAPEEYYGVDLKFKVIKIHVRDMASKIGGMPKLIRQAIYLLQRIQFVRKCTEELERNRADLVYGRDEWMVWLLSRVVEHSKIVWESHEAKFNFPARQILSSGIRCVVISEGIKEFYLKNGVAGSQMLVAHDGIDESFFEKTETKEEARKRLDIPFDKTVAMYIGGLDEWKGVTTFFEATTKLPEVLFVVIGGKEGKIKKLREKHPKVLFLGEHPYRELRDNQQAADILVIPNTPKNKLSSEYTSPLKLFAHMTSGVPLVVSDIPSMRNIVTSEEAFFFKSDDFISLKKTIQDVLSSGAESKKKADRASIKSAQYTWDSRASKIIDFLEMK